MEVFPMINARQSEYLLGCKEKLEQLVDILKNEYDYVSVLATDVSGLSYAVNRKTSSINEFRDSERGFVVRVYCNGGYSEYSFNRLDDVSETAQQIITALNAQSSVLESSAKLKTPLLEEEEAEGEFAGEVSEEFYRPDNEKILAKMKRLRDNGMAREYVVNCSVNYSMQLVNKMFISPSRNLIQAWGVSYVSCVMVLNKDGDTQFTNFGDTGWQGSEIIDKQADKMDQAYEDVVKMFNAPNITPGEYEVICTPAAAGLIAHEAFGHGVEMDMFVKNRAIAKQHMGEKLASTITNMYDGAQGVRQTASYFFDDEGTLAQKTQIIDKGYLVSGICDALSAARLGVRPTGNGRRESFERKVYTRMTNTYFGTQANSLEEMIKSVKYGFLVDGVDSGMEDPKHWGIQCILSRAKEIRNGRLTGKIFTPVVLTGYVPDLLSNISMVGTDIELDGNGHCGKGYKEWVIVSDGGPYLKTKVRLG
ncbi:MAG: TldD/PmbA family protein [Erysipelotrichaceae bacterium]|nr:TldD/PmbA family protein [Erysipelotrichaceae bacterium]